MMIPFIDKNDQFIVLIALLVTCLVVCFLVVLIRRMRRENSSGFYDLFAAEMHRGYAAFPWPHCVFVNSTEDLWLYISISWVQVKRDSRTEIGIKFVVSARTVCPILIHFVTIERTQVIACFKHSRRLLLSSQTFGSRTYLMVEENRQSPTKYLH